jgi:hypothetical protein
MGRANMPGRENSNRNLRTRAGVILLGLGGLLMLANVGWIAVQVERFAASLGFGAFDSHTALALGLLRLLRTIAFDRAAMFSVFGDVLILCFALAGMLAGLTLLRKRTVETA